VENYNYPYFCSECKKNIPKVENSFLIESQLGLPFCSQKCARNHYKPYVNFFENLEKELRQELNLYETSSVSENALNNYLQHVLKDPDEHFLDSDQFKREFHFLVKDFYIEKVKTTFLVVCKFLSDRPSFLLHYVLTEDKNLVEQMIKGIKQQITKVEDAQLRAFNKPFPQEVEDEIKQMRSEIYAQLINDVEEDDIQIEEYYLYQKYEEKTFSNPDEIFEYLDEDKRLLNIYIKAFSHSGEPFFYYIINYIHEHVEKGKMLLPVISFPSNDSSLYKSYARGKELVKKDFN